MNKDLKFNVIGEGGFYVSLNNQARIQTHNFHMIYTPLFRKTEKMTIHRGISLSEKGKAKKQKDEIDSYFYVVIRVIHVFICH